VSSNTTSPSDENHGSGLWLWHGKAPLPPSPPQPEGAARLAVLRLAAPHQSRRCLVPPTVKTASSLPGLPYDRPFSGPVPGRLPCPTFVALIEAETGKSKPFLMSVALPLKVKVESRAITGNARQPASIEMTSSVMPSAKYSCSGSSLRFRNGRTAIARRSSRPLTSQATRRRCGRARLTAWRRWSPSDRPGLVH